MQDVSIVISINSDVTANEIVALRGEQAGQTVWDDCIRESLCVVTARDKGSNELLGIGFLVGNSRHGELVDLVVKPEARKHGIGARIVDEIISFAKNKGIRYFGLTYDKSFPWLKGFYERHGFQLIDFAMWHKTSL